MTTKRKKSQDTGLPAGVEIAQIETPDEGETVFVTEEENIAIEGDRTIVQNEEVAALHAEKFEHPDVDPQDVARALAVASRGMDTSTPVLKSETDA